MVKAGVIGLGVIGGGVALCLARAGLLGAVYDVRSEAANGLDAVPPNSDSPRDVARQCDVVLIAVVTVGPLSCGCCRRRESWPGHGTGVFCQICPA